MKNRKILYVSSEVVPYLPQSEISSMSFEIPKMVNKQGGQIRIFMPRYGNINERRHQLHEVIRLSGLNLVINDLDMPLIIKVASIPKERIQVYFIDNEEYFKVRHVKGLNDLEDQMVTWEPLGSIGSPDRLDALVWAITDLSLQGYAKPQLKLAYSSAKGLR